MLTCNLLPDENRLQLMRGERQVGEVFEEKQGNPTIELWWEVPGIRLDFNEFAIIIDCWQEMQRQRAS